MPISLPLRMIPATAPRVPRAGFLPGSDVAAWLEEMARHPHPEMKFFIVPGSAEDLEPGGLLLVPGISGNTPVSFGPRVQPAAMEHGCVAIPLSMQLDPQITREEAERMLNYACYFFHPSIGLIAFEESDAILPEALVVPPLLKPTSWMHAMPGRPPLPELLHVALALAPDFEGMFGEASEDIGSSNPKDLQRDAGKGARAKDAMGKAIGAFGSWIMSGLSKLGGSGNGGRESDSAQGQGQSQQGGATGKGARPSSPLWNKLQMWTAEQFKKLQLQREGEIQRLLKLLEKDPEKGLRYALPLGAGGDASRGIAPPSGKLGLRNPTFGARGGWGPADIWNLSEHTQWTLRQKYLDLANRELAMGNFDRAAYIFAHLLGDWHAAAGALVRGKRFQEAARIYEEKLNNKPLAAKCLEDGGLLAEAVLLYADLERHEKCGDLLRLLGRERDAVAAYNRALSDSTDRIHDARILYEKLHQPGLAVAVLASGWPSSTQARACLETHFEYLHRLEAHDDALALAMQLGEARNHLQPPLEMARALHAIREKQSDARVRERLGSVAVTTIGHALKACAPGQVHDFTRVLHQIEPSDLLLRRDAVRYAEARVHGGSSLATPPPLPAKSSGPLTLVQQWSLRVEGGIEWNRFLTSGDSWLARGSHRRSQQELWMLGSGDKTMGRLTSGTSWPSPQRLQPHLLRNSTAWLPFSRPDTNEAACYGAARLDDFRNPPVRREVMISRLAWMPPAVLAVFPTKDGVWILHERERGTIDLSYSTLEGKLRRTYALGMTQGELPGPVQMVAYGDEVFISGGTMVLRVANGRVDEEIKLGTPVLRLEIAPPTHAPNVLVVVPGKVFMLVSEDLEEPVCIFESTSDHSIFATFLGDGRIVVGDSKAAKISRPHSLKELGFVTHRFVAVDYSPWSVDSLAILAADGVVRIYR
jgi:tetratricopeptide (TPR) repeat protein